MKDIKVLVLITGQTIIGKIEEEGDFITVESPRMIINPAPGMIDLSHFPFGIPRRNIIIKILAKNVIVMTDLDIAVESDYLASISGIVTGHETSLPVYE